MVRIQAGITRRPSRLEAVPKMPRIWLVMTPAAWSARPWSTPCRLAAVWVMTASAMVRIGSGMVPELGLHAGDPGLDLGRCRELARDDDQAVQQGRDHECDHAQEQADGEQLGEQSGEDARHERIEPVREGQDRVGQHRTDNERQERGPGRRDQLHRNGDERDRDGALGERLGADRPQAVREDLPAHACARPRRRGKR